MPPVIDSPKVTRIRLITLFLLLGVVACEPDQGGDPRGKVTADQKDVVADDVIGSTMESGVDLSPLRGKRGVAEREGFSSEANKRPLFDPDYIVLEDVTREGIVGFKRVPLSVSGYSAVVGKFYSRIERTVPLYHYLAIEREFDGGYETIFLREIDLRDASDEERKEIPSVTEVLHGESAVLFKVDGDIIEFKGGPWGQGHRM